MSRYRVEVTETYADGVKDNPWSVDRRVTAAEGSSCRRPVEVKANGQRRLIACGRRLPAARQCDACLVRVQVVEVRRVQE
ncbi:hypothetical protein [Nonomuraea basaltis]|uniref:hypothetical protein n=1 Tax=Nonomuraea basaltis TaxID=2495887 RepID=UPI00110C5C87|nr:hypothetical protein [Nonomuraea basaltis]TMR99970.1 hypothetical protein EJK15_04155 [Nonomuraea basaltis]